MTDGPGGSASAEQSAAGKSRIRSGWINLIGESVSHVMIESA
jgi:hypothetical protein